jgi:glycosyltransferase involved in cell wall biosynthesis
VSPDFPPRVSIVLPARNAEATLPACLASIARQSERSWECIVVDDGSIDGTHACAAEMARRDARFRVISMPHRGLVAALNTGLAECRAALLARMDADDVMHRHRLSAQIARLDADASLAGVGCHVRIFPRGALSVRLREYEGWLNGLASAEDVSRDAYVECPIAHPTLMMRRAMAALGYLDNDWPEDYDLILRALGAGMRVGVVPRRLHAWRDHGGSLSRTDDRYGQDRFTACKAYYLSTGFLRAHERYILWGYGGTGRALSRALAALGRHPSHIVEVKPGRLGQRIHGAPVVPPDALRALRGTPVVVSVARAGPRAEIRAAMAAMQFVDGRDYVCAA